MITPFFTVGVDINSKHPRLLRVTLAFLLVFTINSHRRLRISLLQSPPTIDKVAQLAATKLCALDTEYERDGVHEIRLPCAIGPDDRREWFEGTDDMVTSIGLEVLQFYANERHGTWW